MLLALVNSSEVSVASRLDHKRVIILVDEGVEQIMVDAVERAVRAERGRADIVAPGSGPVEPLDRGVRAAPLVVDRSVAEIDVADYDALVVPGGWQGIQNLRRHPEVATLVRSFVDAGKTVAALGDAPTLLIEARRARGREVTSVGRSVEELRSAGARWRDASVVVDGCVVTSRSAADLSPFLSAAIRRIQDKPPRPHYAAAMTG
jgi:protease I